MAGERSWNEISAGTEKNLRVMKAFVIDTKRRAIHWLYYFFPDELNSSWLRKIESTKRVQLDVTRAKTRICSLQARLLLGVG